MDKMENIYDTNQVKQDLEGLVNIFGYSELNTDDKDSVFEEVKLEEDLNSIYVPHSQNSFEYSRLCLQINQDYQNLIEKALDELEFLFQQNKERIEKLLKEQQKIVKKNSGLTMSRKKLSVYAKPYFCDKKGRFPPDNEDTIEKRKQNIVDAYSLPPRPWMPSEEKQLSRGVKMNVRDLIMEPNKEKREFWKNKLHNCSEPKEQDRINQKLNDLEKEMANLQSIPIEELLVAMKDKIDWMSVSASSMSGRRGPEECQIRWINYLDPSINRKPFAPQEDEKLKKLSKTYSYDWEMIARKIGTGRTAIQCFQRYQKNINDAILNRYWTEPEDNRLLDLVEEHQIGDFIPWHRVCYYLGKRNVQQVIHRFTRTISPKLKNAIWTIEEDTMLIACVKKFGKQWLKMMDFLPGRSNYHIRERYSNTLNPCLKIGNWTPEEDNKLIKLYNQYGHGKWSKMSQHFENRTDNMCLSRATCLLKHGKIKFFKHSKEEEIEDSDYNVDSDFGTKSKANKYPRTKSCTHLVNRLSYYRLRAQENFVKIWKKIHGCENEEINFDDIDLSKESIQILHKIKTEIFKNEVKVNTSWKPQYNKYVKSNSRISYCEDDDYKSLDSNDDDTDLQNSDTNEDTDEETYMNIEPTQEEENIIEKCLDNIFDAQFKCQANNYMQKIVRNEKSSAEYNIYKSLLFKDFSFQDSSDDIENTVFHKIDYSLTVPKIKQIFVQPSVCKNELPVIAPNFTTLNIMEKLLSFRSILIPSASYVQRSNFILKNLLTDYNKTMKCFFCITKENQEINFMNSENEEKNYVEIRKKINIIDEKVKEDILYEANPFAQTSQFCECLKLHNLRIRFHLMRKRFVSIFLWPAFLSTAHLNENQQHLMTKCQASVFKSFTEREQKIQKKKCFKGILKQELNSSFSDNENSSHSDSDVSQHYLERTIKRPRISD